MFRPGSFCKQQFSVGGLKMGVLRNSIKILRLFNLNQLSFTLSILHDTISTFYLAQIPFFKLICSFNSIQLFQARKNSISLHGVYLSLFIIPRSINWELFFLPSSHFQFQTKFNKRNVFAIANNSKSL